MTELTLLETLEVYRKESKILVEQEKKIDKIVSRNGMGRRLLMTFVAVPLATVLIMHVILKIPDYISTNASLFTMPAYFIWKTIRANTVDKIAIKKMEKIQSVSIKKMNELHIVPKTYYDNYEAITSFIEYLETKQASTIEECIALYHTNKRHNEQVSEIRSLKRQIEYYDYE